MSDIAIRVEGLGKQYHIGGKQERYRTLRDTLTDAVTVPFRRLASVVRGQSSTVADETIWALKDVSFDVKRGEVVGIIGRNGAGKSTLLKILSRITEPTEGRAEICGRVGSLLEVGTGFHPELTGRENIYLNGAILGMMRAEIDRKFDEIVAFSGVEKFIDTPVKRYSSGMRVRLAFSVAAHLDPEILLVDEVLAVGDIEFQHKCLGKMEDVSTAGRTVLFVSHNMARIENLCSNTILLENGQKSLEGETSTVVEKYMDKLRTYQSTVLRNRLDRRGTGELRFIGVKVLDGKGNSVEEVRSGQDCALSIAYELSVKSALSGVSFAISFSNRGMHLFSADTRVYGCTYDNLPKKGKILCKIPRLPIAPGVYQFNVICFVHGRIVDWVKAAGELVVSNGDFFGSGRLPAKSRSGVLIDHSWSIIED